MTPPDEPTAIPASSAPTSSALTPRAAADALNRECFCMRIDDRELKALMAPTFGDAAIAASVLDRRPHLFSGLAAFVSREDIASMLAVVEAAETAAQLPAYQAAALARSSPIAGADHGPIGAFMGYDFHITPEGPRLIEINTNAGGAFLNAAQTAAIHPCCPEVEASRRSQPAASFDDSVAAMIADEWRRQRGDAPLRRIAIVDDTPEQQYLYPEFVLAQRLFERLGFEARIVDACELRHKKATLADTAGAIDLVYNRLVDFDFSQPSHAALAAAYRAGDVVVTPNPRNHALLADKRNLVALSDVDLMRAYGLDQRRIDALAAIAAAEIVDDTNARRLWTERKTYFFKPACGYASKAVYRGDKLTKSVWANIVQGGYIAQKLATPGERSIMVDGARSNAKLDIRLYTYDGALLLAAGRLYQGQTTNFRTPGGGFAPIFLI